MASWSFALTDSNFVPQGEVLNAAERKVALPLNKLPTASMKVRLDHPLAELMMTTQCYLKGYRTTAGQGAPQLRFFGPVISAEESADANTATVALNAVGSGWVLQKRLAGKSSTGTVFTATDRAQIVKTLITTANGEGETNIDYSTGSVSAASTATYTAQYKTILDVLADLGNTFDGFDWRIVPVENYAAGAVTSVKIGRFEAFPVLGATQQHAVFEWGAGRNNIVAYTRSVDRSTQANKVYHNAASGPDAPGFPTVSAIDAASISQWGLLEDLAAADLLDPTLRQRLVDEHVKVRKQPRQVISFTPHIDPTDSGRLPKFGYDYEVGDTVRARASYNQRTRFDVLTRVWGIAFEVNPEGVETQTLTLAQE